MTVGTKLKLGLLRRTSENEFGLFDEFAWYPKRYEGKIIWWRWVRVKSDLRLGVEQELKRSGITPVHAHFALNLLGEMKK